MRSLPALLAAVVVLASVAGVAVADPLSGAAVSTADAGPFDPGVGASDSVAQQTDPAQQTDSGAVQLRVLDVPTGQVSGSTVERASIDVGPSLGFASNTTRARIQTLSMVEKIRTAEDQSVRQRLILGELNRIEQRVITLRSQQAAAIESYANGAITGRQLLIRLAEVDATARELERRRVRLSALAQETEDFAIDQSRIAAAERELDTFTGPVRSHAVAVLEGEAPPARFSVTTGQDSVVLTTLLEDRWVREVYRGDLRRRTGSSMDPETALNVTASSYPDIWTLKRNSTEVVGSGDSFRVSVTHRGGTLTAFIDSGSQNVFKEFQTRELSSMELGAARTSVRDGLRLTVNRSYPGAPLQIRLTRDSTGEPVDANITLGLADQDRSDFVGRTGEDGTLRTLTPREPFTVTAIQGNAVVIVQVEPGSIPRVNPTTVNRTAIGSTTRGSANGSPSDAVASGRSPAFSPPMALTG